MKLQKSKIEHSEVNNKYKDEWCGGVFHGEKKFIRKRFLFHVLFLWVFREEESFCSQDWNNLTKILPGDVKSGGSMLHKYNHEKCYITIQWYVFSFQERRDLIDLFFIVYIPECSHLLSEFLFVTFKFHIYDVTTCFSPCPLALY